MQGHNRYTLVVDGVSSPMSVLSVSGDEPLNQPWHYDVIFTSSDKTIAIDNILTKHASFSFMPQDLSQLGGTLGLLGQSELLQSLSNTTNDLTQKVAAPLEAAKQATNTINAVSTNLTGNSALPFDTSALSKLGSLGTSGLSRTLYGVVTEFSQLSSNKDEAHYRVVLSPRLALLANHHYSAIYQNQSVIAVVESVLRRHSFTGVDYRLELKDSYPAREFITQWQESDLEFIQRLLADIGVWFRFESHQKHGCDVLVMSDYEQGLEDAGSVVYKQPSGTLDAGTESVWDLQLHSKTVEQSVLMQDYNYRDADKDLNSTSQTQPKDRTLHGVNYQYGQHYKAIGDDKTVESGQWYAKIRHEQHISEQCIIAGKSNLVSLAAGQRLRINGHSLSHNLSEGLIILSVQGQGNRADNYEIAFTAIPFDALKPYRPKPIVWPQIGGTLPARVTSPDNDTYGYIDTQGRYRVKLNFDLSHWNSGEESLWVRLAKPYAGETYGFHFPLIDGTEVAIAFTDGNPDRPYIAHAMHDSTHPDHVATANKHRNVIRTPANNKLRMDDKRGQEHIKLATEYGKTQLNIGHLVDQNKEKRGEGFELRTDEWGAIRAGKGLYITTEEQYKAGDLQLKMDSAVKELEQAAHMVKELNGLAQAAKAELADLQTQKQLLEQSLKDLKQPAILNYAPSGIADVTPSSIQQTAGENIIQTAQSSVDISAFKRFMVTAGNMISLFANKMGIKIFASKGNVDIQAQNNEMLLTAK